MSEISDHGRPNVGATPDTTAAPGVPRRNRLIVAVEKYAAANLRVLPLHTVRDGGSCSCGNRRCASAGKHPVAHLVPRGFKDATTDIKTIDGWLAQGPWNIGAVPGPDYVVLDVDPRKPGELERVTKIVERYGDFANTLRMATGRYEVDGETLRGHHYWFRLPSGVEVKGGTIEGIEIKSTGGYVVMPPSRHASGVNYEIEYGSLSSVADAPLWLIDSAPRGAERARAVGETSDVTGQHPGSAHAARHRTGLPARAG
ncbi:MAG: bifunctional DNA primase/polymerase [Patulibacter sp.]|nr:bifunctional DNA primase/polymerase [Patulibacter sp.]